MRIFTSSTPRLQHGRTSLPLRLTPRRNACCLTDSRQWAPSSIFMGALVATVRPQDVVTKRVAGAVSSFWHLSCLYITSLHSFGAHTQKDGAETLNSDVFCYQHVSSCCSSPLRPHCFCCRRPQPASTPQLCSRGTSWLPQCWKKDTRLP